MHRVVAEFIGTFALVFAGCGAIVIDAETGGTISHLGIAISFGLVIMVMIYATGHISGAHLNPAVTLTFALTRHLPFERAIGYWAGQLVGAISAALALRVLFGNTANLGATVPRGSAWQSFLLEIILTFMVMFVIMAVATDVRAVGQAAAIAIGGTVGLCAMFGGPISGASMNPARSLGPALVSSTWNAQWVYLIAPVIGAVLGGLAYQFIRGDMASPMSHLRITDPPAVRSSKEDAS